MLDILPCTPGSLVVQHLGQNIKVLKVSRFLIASVQRRKLKSPTKTGGVGSVVMSNCDWISLAGNIILWCCDRNVPCSSIGRNVTFGASLRFFPGRTGVSRRWPGRKGVNRLAGMISREEEAEEARPATREGLSVAPSHSLALQGRAFLSRLRATVTNRFEK